MRKNLFFALLLLVIAGVLTFQAVSYTPPVVPIVAPVATPSPTITPMSIEEFDRLLKEKGKGVWAEGIIHEATPRPTAIPTAKPEVYDPNEKGKCFVDKNGTYEMTSAECKAIYDENPYEFTQRALRACIDGKNEIVGDGGSQESRMQPCKDALGLN